MFRTVIPLLLLPAAMLIPAVARAESGPEEAAPKPFLKDEGSWVAGFLNPEGVIVIRPHHDLAGISPFADIDQAAFLEAAPSSGSSEPALADEPGQPEEASGAVPAAISTNMADLAVNVPDLPQIIDRMGTAVLLLSACLIAAMIYRKRMTLRGKTLKEEPRMRVVGRMPVSRRGEVCLVEIDRRLMVVGLDAQGIRTLVPLDSASPPVPTFSEVQSQVMSRSSEVGEQPTPPDPEPSPGPPVLRPPVRRRSRSLLSR